MRSWQRLATISAAPTVKVEGMVEPADLSERQWHALGELRRMEVAGHRARRGGTVNLGTLKALEAAGLVEIGEDGEPDNRGRRWTAALTDDGRQVLTGPAAPGEG